MCWFRVHQGAENNKEPFEDFSRLAAINLIKIRLYYILHKRVHVFKATKTHKNFRRYPGVNCHQILLFISQLVQINNLGCILIKYAEVFDRLRYFLFIGCIAYLKFVFSHFLCLKSFWNLCLIHKLLMLVCFKNKVTQIKWATISVSEQVLCTDEINQLISKSPCHLWVWQCLFHVIYLADKERQRASSPKVFLVVFQDWHTKLFFLTIQVGLLILRFLTFFRLFI